MQKSKVKTSSYAKAASFAEAATKAESEDKRNYNPSEIESRWQAIWEKEKIYSPNLDTAKKPFYNLMMFPYPSAEGMHVGNMYAFTGADVYGRFQRMQGKDVFEPIGLDGFGIHSENYAIKVGNHPVEQAKISEKNYYKQLHAIGNGFDWTRTVETYKPEYYKWTQWLFIQLFKAGLAYRKRAMVNFCPSCKTVLADEQVIDGRCERCGTLVVRERREQWFFRITRYAEKLLGNIEKLNWSEKVKTAQRAWIGRSEGALITFKVKNSHRTIDVFTTRQDTLFGATFLVVSPEHPLVADLFGQGKDVMNYLSKAVVKSEQERIAQGKEKEGVPTRYFAINPVNNQEIPIWIADYVLMEYGTGAIMGVPAHDQRDYEFAIKYSLPIRQVIIPTKKSAFADALVSQTDLLDDRLDNLKQNITQKVGFVKGVDLPGVEPGRPGLSSRSSKPAKPTPKSAYTGFGILVNSGKYTGLSSKEATEKMIKDFESLGIVRKEVIYHLRDWLISRQRYWGPPIPLVFCENCARRIKDKGLMIKDEFSKGEIENPGWIAVKQKDLPVKLPFIEDYKPLGTGRAPLAGHPEFYKTKCPNCGGSAKRETDVSDTFLDSSWYFLRYLATEFDDIPFPSKKFQLSVLGSQFSESGRSVLSQSVTEKQKTGKLESENRQQKTDNRTKWLPVNMYIGGAEHSVLHLLYSRFITMVLKDLGFISFEEPFTKFRAHGLIVKDGAKMSKSKGNVVIPDEYIKKFGADTLRTYLMFMGPFSQGGDFRDTGVEGMHRFLKRIWRLFSEHSENSENQKVRQSDTSDNQKLRSTESSEFSEHMMHKTIKKVTEDIEGLNYNTAIAALMEWYNYLNQKSKIPPKARLATGGKNQKLTREELETFVKLLAPFAPHVSEELWSRLSVFGSQSSESGRSVISQSGKLITDKQGAENRQQKTENWSIHNSYWPTFDSKFLVKDELIIVIQVNGKLRGNLVVDVATSKNKAKIEELAKKDSRAQSHLEGKSIKKVIYVEGKVVNFVTA